jgi:hypothetical protein
VPRTRADFLEFTRNDLHGHVAGNLARRMTTHSVGHNEEPAGRIYSGVKAVLVARPDNANVCSRSDN